MALLVVLAPTDGPGLDLRAETAETLARLGVTSLSLARDEEVTVAVLEGWAFDASCYDAALAAIGAGADARALQQVAHLAVSTASTEGGASR